MDNDSLRLNIKFLQPPGFAQTPPFPILPSSREPKAPLLTMSFQRATRGRGRFAGKRLDLNAINAVVEDIAQDPMTLTPKPLKALGACQCAITLRQHVALFFDDQERGHRHFLSFTGTTEIRRFENYYQVLQEDEDYFPDEETFIKDKGASKKSKAERKRLFDGAFAQDLQMEVVCFFMELEELVKKQEKTMMEATVVGTLALHMANQLTIELQLRYPALKLAEDLIGVLVCCTSSSLAARITKAKERRTSFEEDGTPNGPGRGFMNAMEEYFVTREVTIQLVFLCICWMQTVIGLTIKHTEDLIQTVKTSLPKRSLPAKGDSLHALMKDILSGFHVSLRHNHLARVNPLFAGSQMMSNHLEFLFLGGGLFSRTCRAFCQLYNALVQQGFLERIPFIDDMLEIYEEMIFNPSSRATAVHGSYHRVYLLTSNWSGSSIDATYESPVATGKYDANSNMLSLTYRLMQDDLSFSMGPSSKTMLKKAADACTKEMFQTRILSRDLMTLNDDLMDIFSDI
ncbi:hypothetical protein GQ600_8803 [Phytophthora cactorum]|nr:hypothetical protein GQ600_8803 [Phytophthora cactorum]